MIKAAEVKGLMPNTKQVRYETKKSSMGLNGVIIDNESNISYDLTAESFNNAVSIIGSKTLRLDREKTAIWILARANPDAKWDELEQDVKNEFYKEVDEMNSVLKDLLIAE